MAASMQSVPTTVLTGGASCGDLPVPEEVTRGLSGPLPGGALSIGRGRVCRLSAHASGRAASEEERPKQPRPRSGLQSRRLLDAGAFARTAQLGSMDEGACVGLNRRAVQDSLHYGTKVP